ncbi:Reverse transcriptase domain-containing protein [Aphis craccivora]|uniref:Reverse transcriptase domain-containing protein n=1 Tax=Aphis craccivora TaxID=307492 RepID=A0A6G0ZQK2_APHCR|nr:Reverse transcriptase domain-containing protein [Aphis craccivora]
MTRYKWNHKEAKIRKGVRQGCPLSPYLFNLFMEEAIEEMKEVTNSVRTNGDKVHSIRFADDIALVTKSEGNMNLMLNTLSRVMDKYHMKINATKTKTMTARRDQIYTNPVIKLNDTKKFIKTFVWSVLLYGCETWTIRKNEKDCLEAMEMWILRKMNKTSWVERKTNEQVLRDISGKRSRRRLRTSYFQDLKHLMEVTTYSKLKNVAKDLWLSRQGEAFR